MPPPPMPPPVNTNGAPTDGAEHETETKPGPPAKDGPPDIVAQIEQSLPDPKNGGYSRKGLTRLADETNDAAKAISKLKAVRAALAGNDIPMAEPPPEGDDDMVQGKIPTPTILPALLLSDLAVSFGGDAGQKYGIDPATLVDDDAIDLLCATIMEMGKDKALAKAIEAHGTPEKGTPKKGPPPPKKGEPEGDEMGGSSDGDGDEPGAMAYA